jgi:hypothetical protein
LAETTQGSIVDLIREVRERLGQELNSQAGQLGKIEQAVQELREQQRKLEETIQAQLDVLAQYEPPPPPPPPAPAPTEAPLDNLLGSVRNLITATLPEQVLDVLTEEAEQLGVRAAIFDVRGKAAWGASARGFGEGLSAKAFRGLVVPLNQDTPFRQVFETGGHVDLTADALRKNRNVLERLKPHSSEPILMLPIRSAGSVSAIFYADPGGKGSPLPVDALKILAEFAGAQLDRLMALGGGVPSEAPEAEIETVEAEAVAAPPAEETPAAQAAPSQPEAAPAPVEEAAPPPPPTAPEPPPVEASPPVEAAPAPTPAPAMAGVDLSQLSEEEQKIHKDAKRFAKLLISEIELYNKAKVADGRKNNDLYKRLKTDIDRSRLTYEKRFGKTVAKQYDYFHEELVRALAASNAAVLGSDYPGPST